MPSYGLMALTVPSHLRATMAGCATPGSSSPPRSPWPSPPSARHARRRAPTAPAAATVVPVSAPGKTAQIRRVSSVTEDGWRFDFFQNPGLPLLGQRRQHVHHRDPPRRRRRRGPPAVGLHARRRRRLLRPNRQGHAQQRPEGRGGCSAPAAQHAVRRAEGEGGRRAPSGFRMMAVSMCNHDIYGGGDTVDPNNPNRDTTGKLRTVNGLFATKAAVQYALTTRATDDFFLHGGSAGSFGSFHMGWALEAQGIKPAGIISESGVMNQAWQLAVQDKVCGRAPMRRSPPSSSGSTPTSAALPTSRTTSWRTGS